MTPSQVIKDNLNKDIKEKSVKYGTTNIQLLDAIIKSEKDLSVSILLSVKEILDKKDEKTLEGAYHRWHNTGYNNAVEDFRSLLTEELEKIKNI